MGPDGDDRSDHKHVQIGDENGPCLDNPPRVRRVLQRHVRVGCEPQAVTDPYSNPIRPVDLVMSEPGKPDDPRLGAPFEILYSSQCGRKGERWDNLPLCVC